jgi:AcrR family transcriptional regulator
MSERKAELIDAAIAYLLRHGLADLSLRPLAAEIGTSARLLIYHFGSKDGLLAEVLDAMQARLRDSFAKLGSAPASAPARPLLRTFWDWAVDDRNLPSLKLLYELQILAAQNPAAYAGYLERNPKAWLDLVHQVAPSPEQSPAMATLLIAVFDGLFLELMSTGDRARTTQALDEFIALVLAARRARAVPAAIPRSKGKPR